MDINKEENPKPKAADKQSDHWVWLRPQRLDQLMFAVLFVVIFAGLGVYLLVGGRADTPFAGSITSFTNPAFLTDNTGLSFWNQPSRAYMNTVPATTLLNAVNINFSGGHGLNSVAALGQIDH
jgi:hypothetical protein